MKLIRKSNCRNDDGCGLEMVRCPNPTFLARTRLLFRYLKCSYTKSPKPFDLSIVSHDFRKIF